jgi:hypothetical protein
MMKHKLLFSGKEINLDQPSEEVKSDLQSSIDRFFPCTNDYVIVDSCGMVDKRTFEIHITRMYANGAGAGLKDFICDQDESLITGLQVSAFQPYDPNAKPVVAPMCRWGDNMIYSPICVFCDLWKLINKKLVGEEIESVTIEPNVGSIFIKVVYGE